MTSTTKRKHSEIIPTGELFDICNGSYRNKEERFDLIRQWLHDNKDDNGRLKVALTYQELAYWTPLHLIVRKQPPLDIIQTIIKYAPEVLILKNTDGKLPIHVACHSGASLEVIQALVSSYPDSIKAEDNYGNLPLHLACWNNDVSLDVLNFLIESYPEGVDHKNKVGRTPLDILKQEKYAKKKDHNGMLSLHHACKNGYSDHLICLLIQANPNSIEIKDKHGRTPLDYYTSFQGRQLCDEIIELLQPVDNRIRKIRMVSSAPASVAAHNAVAPPVAQIDIQPLPQKTGENEVEIRNAEMNDMKAELKVPLATKEKACKKDTLADHNVSPALSSESFQTANLAVSHGSASVAHSKMRSYQEIKKDFEEAGAALLQAINEKNERRIRFFEIANDVLIEELESKRQK